MEFTINFKYQETLELIFLPDQNILHSKWWHWMQQYSIVTTGFLDCVPYTMSDGVKSDKLNLTGLLGDMSNIVEWRFYNG